MTVTDATPKRPRRHSAPLLWASGGLAATILVLGVTGTLSAWTTAIIHNDTDTTSATDSVALAESTGAGLCVDTSTTATNEATCSTVNKYGGTSAPLVPGAAGNATTVTLTNTGSTTGDLVLSADACTMSGGISGATDDICDYVDLLVECPGGTTTYSGTLSAFAAAGDQAVDSVAAGDSVSCTFTVSLPSTAPADIATQVASQPLTWTLSA